MTRSIETTRIARSRLYSLSMPAPELDVHGFLHAAVGQERFFWQEPNGGLALAGSGVAYEVKAWGERRFSAVARVMRRLFDRQVRFETQADSPEEKVRPRFFGGFSFQEDFVPDHVWDAFSPAHFILPHFQLTSLEGSTWLTVNALLPTSEDRAAVRPALQQALEMRLAWLQKAVHNRPVPSAPPAAQEPLTIRYPMSFGDWSSMLEAGVSRIAEGRMRKVVLARMCELSAAAPFDLDAAVHYLNQNYPECYRFLFEPRPGHAFFGATPELLAAVEGDQLRTMALAGSIRRGQTAGEDAALAAALMSSLKDRYEHDLVARMLSRRLRPRCLAVEAPAEPEVLTLSNIQHLHTPFKARLQKPGQVLNLISHLHPTPALGGDPDQAAQAFIREAEPVTRGWYAAPVGWVDAQANGVFAVAIRSAVVQHERAWLYAGAGIVRASEPETEWAETGLKFRPMFQALGAPPQVAREALLIGEVVA